MHTNTTTNYDLPQFVGTDKPSWLGDVNGAMSAIDTAIHAREVEAGTAQASADTANAKADTLDTRMGTAETNITALQNASTTDHAQIATNTSSISQNAQDIVQLDAKIGHTQITIGDNTVTGAIAELANGGGITVDSTESTTSENPLQNKVITVAMNAIRSLNTAVQNLLGSTDISSIDDGTVTGSLSDLNSRLTVLENGAGYETLFDSDDIHIGNDTKYYSNLKYSDVADYSEVVCIAFQGAVGGTNAMATATYYPKNLAITTLPTQYIASNFTVSSSTIYRAGITFASESDDGYIFARLDTVNYNDNYLNRFVILGRK